MTTEREKDGSATFGPRCRCGSHRTRRIFGLRRFCHSCNRIFEWRVVNGSFVPLGLDTAATLDERRAEWSR